MFERGSAVYQIAICDDEISDLQHNIQLTEHHGEGRAPLLHCSL